MKNRITMAGFAATALGLMLVFGQSFGQGLGSAQAGNIPCDATATSDPTPNPDPQAGVIQAFQAPPECTATSTKSATPPRQIKTHTPTATATSVPNTPVPPTEPPATNTPRPSSGNEGAAIAPPATGFGDGTASSDHSLWVLVAGALLMILGGGAALVGIRQRR